MTESNIVLVALSDELCNLGNINLRKLMANALRVEKRMETKVLIEDEQRRYNTFCDRIEFYGHRLLAEGKVESCNLGNRYLEILTKMKQTCLGEFMDARLMANFQPKEMVSSHINIFESLAKKLGIWNLDAVQKKIEFYQKAARENMNVVELLQSWLPSTEVEAVNIDSDKLTKSFLALKISDSITEDKGGGHFKALQDQILRVVDLTKKNTPAAVNFSELRHDVIAEVLHYYTYGVSRPVSVNITYADGSEASPFPLFGLKSKSAEELAEFHQLPVINVGMMSARHSNDGLDIQVKIYWFRNQEISIGRTQAETDDVAYRKSKEQFLKLRSEGPYRMAFYQTGFQPAVVGFYRALTEELMERAKDATLPKLEVTPYYFMGGDYKIGKVWN